MNRAVSPEMTKVSGGVCCMPINEQTSGPVSVGYHGYETRHPRIGTVAIPTPAMRA